VTAILGRIVAAAPTSDEQEACVRVMDSVRTRRSAGLASRSGPNWLAAVAKGRVGDAWFSADAFALIHGKPRIVDSELAAAERERGLAHACASAYERDGPKFLARLEGPFALAIRLDRQNKTLLAVDRLGVLSLFYAATPESLSFASELGLMVAVPGIELRIDQQAIYDYLYFHMIPSPRTAYERVRRLPPAGFVERTHTGDATGRYWEPRFERESGSIDFGAEKQTFVRLLESGIRAELAAAGKVGCFLSGGTDSSTLAGMVTRVAGEPARTYSIGFDQSGFDEIEYARIAARHFGTRHKEYYVDATDIVRILPRLAAIYGQPFGNSSVVPTFCCAEMAGADGVETMIGGDGGDELFGGNQRYATQLLFSYYESVPLPLRKFVLEPLAFKMPGASGVPPLRKLGRYIEQASEPMPDRLQTYNYLNLMNRAAMLEPDFVARVDTEDPERVAAAEYRRTNARTLLNKMLVLDWKHTLADNDLPKVIETCDAASVDVAFPFLQPEIFDFAARLPATQKVNRLRLRYFFKKALGDFLPIEIIRKKKHGFGMPFGDWILAPGALRDLAFDNLSEFRKRRIVRAEFIAELLSARLVEHANYYGGLIWVFLVLELWLQWHERAHAKADST
jgi:asparagine synthase (glutamine-hydrolysing)